MFAQSTYGQGYFAAWIIPSTADVYCTFPGGRMTNYPARVLNSPDEVVTDYAPHVVDAPRTV
jgi:hypothetical protein